MLHDQEDEVRELLLDGEIGLEKESLRITGDGHLAQTADPFVNDKHIVKDFCENQVEVNTSPWPTSKEALAELVRDTEKVRKCLTHQERPEYLWPFSNPPYLTGAENVPIAQYYGEERTKTEYRKYLAKKYGTYLMTFSGIHVNFSFSEKLLKANFKYEGGEDYRHYKDGIYLNLAQQMLRYGWILNILTSASPILDGSYFQNDDAGRDIVTDYASVRCSEKGYWNPFVAVMDYSSTDAYVDSIAAYVDKGLLRAPSELYFPIRLKAGTTYTLDHLRTGWTHIEIRTFDLNPFLAEGLDQRDVDFAHLLMVWLACRKQKPLTEGEKILGADYFKRSAHLHPEQEKVFAENGTKISMTDAAKHIMEEMMKFYDVFHFPVQDVLNFENEKLEHPEKRYAYRVLDEFSDGFVKKGIVQAEKLSGVSE